MRISYLIPSLIVILASACLLAAQQATAPRNQPQPPAPEVPASGPAQPAKQPPAKPAPAKDAAAQKADSPVGIDGISGELTYTTYFYTAAEAIIHGFENDTKVRIISMEKKGTVYEGKIDRMQTQLVRTGKGVFTFVANKKASILVGTPTSCAVIGYWLRDQDGNSRAKQLFTHTPSSHAHNADCRIVVWAWEDVKVDITDQTAQKKLAEGVAIKAGKYHELKNEALHGIDSHVVSFQADKKAISVQVYYDEGFTVPSANGSGAGKLFYTYVGTITEGVNDLSMISYYVNAKVRVEDVNDGTELWKGEVAKGSIHTLTLKGKHVKVTSDADICVQVCPYEHYKAGYAEHHFGVGGEGTGIETEFLITTPGELWIFSYYPANEIQVTDVKSGKEVWAGKLGEGEVRDVHPGHGFFRVKASKGVGTMAGANCCGGEFSSATNQFAVDESLFKVVQEIREQRQAEATKSGRAITADELNAPPTAAEMQLINNTIKKDTGRTYNDGEVNDRLRNLQRQQQEKQKK
ncbi:hypothetical protein AYO44_11305 [Planctomycetaceae bacterium SCGC AG-212-F19]|nr:hypothetical protein AYO44_11305 [Planctomycetaceae bacterium SCGC AG-212-F19]